jgi:5-methylcytosine-specific restriction endonuclease McrA
MSIQIKGCQRLSNKSVCLIGRADLRIEKACGIFSCDVGSNDLFSRRNTQKIGRFCYAERLKFRFQARRFEGPFVLDRAEHPLPGQVLGATISTYPQKTCCQMPVKPNPIDRPWRQWYQLEVWRRRRRLHLQQQPLCAFCIERGVVTPATIADHVVPHRGNWNSFRLGTLQSLCNDCHVRMKHHFDLHGYTSEIGADGWPLDPRHPANGGNREQTNNHAGREQTNIRHGTGGTDAASGANKHPKSGANKQRRRGQFTREQTNIRCTLVG